VAGVRPGYSARGCTGEGTTPGGSQKAGKYELYTDKGGKFRWPQGSNGEIIATSEAYNSKASAKNGIESVQKNAPGAPVVEV
jgi:uncharacterized protein YegP (UPF0339 family)